MLITRIRFVAPGCNPGLALSNGGSNPSVSTFGRRFVRPRSGKGFMTRATRNARVPFQGPSTLCRTPFRKNCGLALGEVSINIPRW